MHFFIGQERHKLTKEQYTHFCKQLHFSVEARIAHVLGKNEAESCSGGFWQILALDYKNKAFWRKVACVFQYEAQKLLSSCLVFPKSEAQHLEKKVAYKKKLCSGFQVVVVFKYQIWLKRTYLSCAISLHICRKDKNLLPVDPVDPDLARWRESNYLSSSISIKNNY